ncbi:uncharacterized protein BO87DRAFT_428245 [Aspergillus neoniger CBS 115656]|uniref:Uncharacterized protein n=1 Tax=Aspergillus neoniger (strain CBS 115656) TaxID=1448310 RepID=A0A318YDB4_ASPNB|nr:hypothetical protein BO87DRAFT_428245 [Aspergillus neoniger CBS 115656]PYH32004.1 hypothetical protein BO87DRAFT_428245 [Aspergillus neoniger CBS 115656]
MAATALAAAAALLVPLLLGLTEVNTSYVDHNIKGSPDQYDFTTGTIALCGILLQALHWRVILAGFAVECLWRHSQARLEN